MDNNIKNNISNSNNNNDNKTVWQRLSYTFGPNSLLNQDVPTYKFDKKELLRTQNKVEFEREKLQAQQSFYLANQWSKIDNHLYTQAVYYEPTRLSSFYDFESMEYSIAGETKIATPNGFITIKELADKGRDYEFITYAYDHNLKKVVPAKAYNAHYTRDEMTYKITFDDNSHIIATHGHRFLKRDGVFCVVEELQVGDSMMPFYRKSFYDNQNYNWVYSCNKDEGHNGWVSEHKLIAEWFYDKKINFDEEVHHIDFNGKNNLPENLQIMTFKDHAEYHAQNDNKGENNSHYSGYTNEQIEKFALDLTKEYGRKVSSNEWESAVKQNGMPMAFSSWRRTNWFKSPASLLSWCASELGYDNVDPRVARQLGKLESNGYNAYIQDGAVWVKKSCGNPSCNKEMHLHHSDKHAVYCSKKCSASTEENISDFIKRSRAGKINKQQITFENQVKIFNDLKDSLGREPKKIEWESACKDNGVSGRIRTEIPEDYTNPYVFHTYNQLKETASTYNHKVIGVQYLEGLHDVYNITVDNNHTVGIVTNDSGEQMSGIFVTQCCEIALRPFQFCNLCEVNVSDVVDQEDLEARTKAATFIGTLQASYTDFHYLRPIWQRTTEKEALLGVGMTGIGSGVAQKLDVKAAAKAAKEENERVAGLLGINKAARVTTIKPSGTTSCVLGTSSGIHAWHDEYYLRRIRIGKNEALYPYLKENHPQLVEDEYFRPHDTAVVGVPQKAPSHAILRTESPIQLLERVKWFNTNWIRQGHRTGMNTHNISATVSIREHEWDAVGNWLWTNKESYNGISVLPYDGGSYIQSPFETITKEEYERLMETLHEIDLKAVIEMDDNTEHSQEVACSGAACEITF